MAGGKKDGCAIIDAAQFLLGGCVVVNNPRWEILRTLVDAEDLRHQIRVSFLEAYEG
jgi:hypothetical protein